MKLSIERKEELDEVQRIIGIKFNDIDLLNQAFVHSSYVNEQKLSKLESNERLEYLGDAVLGLITSEYIFKKYPESDEGGLTKIKSVLVSKPILAKESLKLNLGKFILLGRGEEGGGGRERASILSNVFESTIGAIFLDKGIIEAKEFLNSKFLSDSESEEKKAEDYKSNLQEIFQAKYKKRPVYEVENHSGPEHRKTFSVSVSFKGKVIGKGNGRSKKEAEQEAAKDALLNLKQN